MCASCGCGCKSGVAAKGCKCTCKTCREARTMSVEKFHLVNKANRGFEAIADALLDEVYEDDLAFDEDDLVVDEEGNVYALVGEIEKADDPHRNAKAGAVGGALGAAGLTAYQAKELRQGHQFLRAFGISNKSIARAYGKGLGRRFGGAAGGGALGGAVVDYARKKNSKVEKGLPSVARQAMRSGKDTSGMSTAMQFRMGMNQTGRNAARNLSATGGSPFASSSIAAGQGGKQTYRNLTGQNNAVDRGKLGGEQGKRRLAEITARRQARQAALASRRQQNAQQTGRGVLP